MTDDDRQPPHDDNERRAAKERMAHWLELPRHKPTKADDEKTRTGDIEDPNQQEKP